MGGGWQPEIRAQIALAQSNLPLLTSMKPGAQEDRELVLRMKRRDPQSMVTLYDRYGKLIYSVILRSVRNEATAEDLVQETFFRIWNRIHTFDEERGQFEGWLVTVARNRAFDYMRSMRNTPSNYSASLDDLEQAGLFSSRETQADKVARESAINKALEALSEEQREVIELTHFEGMTQTEIADRMKKPLGTVKSLVRSALKNLRMVTIRGGTQ